MSHFSRRPAANPNQSPYEFDAALLKTGQILEVLRAVFNSPNYRPPHLPAVALKVHSLSEKPRVYMDEVVGVVEQDGMLAADVLKIAGSAAYTTSMPPRTISEAVMRLGLDRLKSVVWESAMSSRVFRAPGLENTMRTIRQHSVAIAHIARIVAYQTMVVEEQAFLHGLLHNVGLTAIIIAIADIQRQGMDIDLEGSVQAIEEARQEAGVTVAKLWNLDSELTASIVSQSPGSAGQNPVLEILTVSDVIARDLGYTVKLGDTPLAGPTPSEFEQSVASLRLPSTDSLRVACARRLEEALL